MSLETGQRAFFLREDREPELLIKGRSDLDRAMSCEELYELEQRGLALRVTPPRVIHAIAPGPVLWMGEHFRRAALCHDCVFPELLRLPWHPVRDPNLWSMGGAEPPALANYIGYVTLPSTTSALVETWHMWLARTAHKALALLPGKG